MGLERRTLRQEHSLSVKQGQRLRLNVTNQTMMTHPLHVHGHTLALADTGLRKDTLLLRPMETRAIDLVASGWSPSEATAFVVMGKSISPDAVRRIELIAGSYLRRLDAERAVRRSA